MSLDQLTREERALLEGGLKRAMGKLMVERLRQVDEEGYNPKHDEKHAPAELAAAAAAYAASAATVALAPDPTDALHFPAWIVQRLWPWWRETFKPKSPERDLVRAGALVIAALERIEREAAMHADVEAG